MVLKEVSVNVPMMFRCLRWSMEPLLQCCVSFFQDRDLCHTFKIPEKVLLTFFVTLGDHYVSDVPYHNSVHAADVLNSTNILLNSPALQVRISKRIISKMPDLDPDIFSFWRFLIRIWIP